MTGRENAKDDVIRKIDQAIRDRIREAEEFDEQGRPYAAVPASDKHGLARKVGVDMEDIQERLHAVCDEITGEDGHAAIPRYRLKSSADTR